MNGETGAALPVVSVVLGSFNRLSFLKATIKSVRNELDGVEHGEIIVVDGGSTDGSLKWLARQKDVITIIQHNRGIWRGKRIVRRSWGYFMNLGFKCAQGKYVCMLSDDCLLVPGSLKAGIDHFDAQSAAGKKVGAVAFFWRNWPEQDDYCVGLTLGNKMFVNHGLYSKAALEDVGYADENNYLFYHADGDLCLRMWEAGWSVIECPSAFVEHFSHANGTVRRSNLTNQQKDWHRYQEIWAKLLGSGGEQLIGDWIYRKHEDASATYRQFPLVQRISYRCKRKFFDMARRVPHVHPRIRTWLS